MKKFFKIFDCIFAYYFISMGISLLVGILLNFPIKMVFCAYTDLTAFFVGFVCVCISLFILWYRDGYHSTNLEIKPLLLSAGILLALLIVITLLIGRAIYISGPTDYLAYYILHKANPHLINGKVMHNRLCLWLMTGAFVFVYMPLMVLGKYLGFKRKRSVFNSWHAC